MTKEKQTRLAVKIETFIQIYHFRILKDSSVLGEIEITWLTRGSTSFSDESQDQS